MTTTTEPVPAELPDGETVEPAPLPLPVHPRAVLLMSVLDPHGVVVQDAAGAWARWDRVDLPAMAHLMLREGVRLVTMTARPDGEDGALRLIYHWDLGSTMLHVSTVATDGAVPTIADVVPGADWAEREIRDYYDLTFTGRSDTPTLMLLPGDPPGLFSRTAGRGRDVEPGLQARRLAETVPAAPEEVEPA